MGSSRDDIIILNLLGLLLEMVLVFVLLPHFLSPVLFFSVLVLWVGDC